MLFRLSRLTFSLPLLAVLALFLAPAAPAAPPTGDGNPAARGQGTVQRLVVRWKDDADSSQSVNQGDSQAALAQRRARVQQSAGVTVRAARHLTGRSDLFALGEGLSGARLAARIAALQADPAIASVHPDIRVFAHAAAPNDPRFAAGSDSVGSWRGQWFLGPPSVQVASAINALGAWDVTEGLDTVVVAVLDTGVVFTHADLLRSGAGGKLLDGFDFVSCDTGAITCTADAAYNNSHNCTSSSNTCTLVANDGNGWDNDPSDPGDWIDSTDLARTDGFFAGCGTGDNSDQPEPSSWHGTRVAALIGALTHNSVGVAGVAPNTLILPARVLGKCGGYLADVIDAMRWSAGLTVSGAPTNTHPAKVINLSLGSSVPCTAEEQSAIDDVIAAGAVVVASAGNDGGPTNAPANCKGVLSVSGLRHNGNKVGYSSVSGVKPTSGTSGPSVPVTIGAPAGNCGDNYVTGTPCLYSIETATNEGSTTPSAGSFYTYAVFAAGYTGNDSNEASVGTSFSAPLAAGTAALMFAVDSSLTPAQLIKRMQDNATAFPVVATDSNGTAIAQCVARSTHLDSDGFYTDIPSASESVGCNCTKAACGAGMLNAAAAVTAAAGPYAQATPSKSTAGVGDRVNLSAAGSHASNGHTLASYHWSSDVSIANPDSANAAYLVFPSTRPLAVTLKVTDDAGATDTTTITIEGAVKSTDNSGGGALLIELPALALAALFYIRRRRAPARPGVQ